MLVLRPLQLAAYLGGYLFFIKCVLMIIFPFLRDSPPSPYRHLPLAVWLPPKGRLISSLVYDIS